MSPSRGGGDGGGSQPDEGCQVPPLHVSYKPQKIAPKFEDDVRSLLSSKIRDMFVHPQFQTDVTKPLQIERLLDQKVCGAGTVSYRFMNADMCCPALFVTAHRCSTCLAVSSSASPLCSASVSRPTSTSLTSRRRTWTRSSVSSPPVSSSGTGAGVERLQRTRDAHLFGSE